MPDCRIKSPPWSELCPHRTSSLWAEESHIKERTCLHQRWDFSFRFMTSGFSECYNRSAPPPPTFRKTCQALWCFWTRVHPTVLRRINTLQLNIEEKQEVTLLFRREVLDAVAKHRSFEEWLKTFTHFSSYLIGHCRNSGKTRHAGLVCFYL